MIVDSEASEDSSNSRKKAKVDSESDSDLKILANILYLSQILQSRLIQRKLQKERVDQNPTKLRRRRQIVIYH